MKALTTILTTLAVANLLALSGFIGWLVKSDRLNRERLEAIRAMFSTTITEEAASKAEAERQKQEAQDAAEAAAKALILPVRSAEKLAQGKESADADLQNKLRLESELRALQEFLVRENDRLVRLEGDLKQREAMFAQERKKIEETAGTEQFQKAMATLGGMKPADARAMLSELLGSGHADEVTAYLNAMDERQRSKVMTEFIKSDPKVAASLLEQLRRYGVGPDAAEAPAYVPASSGS
ncbi:MAG: hypothetical protein AB7G11_05080 [Phycisphaerales bacterium]